MDQLTDTGLVAWHRFSKLYSLPELVKSAEDHRPPQDIPGMFAHQSKPYRFPIHSKEATLVSWLYFLHDDQLSSRQKSAAQNRLEQAARLWRVENEVVELQHKFAAVRTPAPLEDSDYGLITVEDGQRIRRYPLRNAKEVRAAAGWVEVHLPELRTQHTFAERQQLAETMLMKAAEFGTALTESQQELLDQMACRGFTSPLAITESITARLRGGQKVAQELRMMMQQLAAGFDKRASLCLDSGVLSDLATTLEDFDRNHGLLNKYSDLIPSPEATVCSITHTKAAQVRAESCCTETGSIYGHSQLAKLTISDVRAVFGHDVAEQARTGLSFDPVKFAKIAETFPRTQAQYLDDLMSEKGEQPLFKDAAVRSFQLSLAELQEAATVAG